MQNNVTELTQKLLKALDSKYNVTDMPQVIDVISLLEKVVITKELLETTRLGKHINELRKKISNESLKKRAKDLLKKWRSMVLPETNGQTKTSPPLQAQQLKAIVKPVVGLSAGPTVKISPPLPAPMVSPVARKVSPGLPVNADVNLNQVPKGKKRPAREAPDSVAVTPKKARLNGGVTDLELSDSNSSFMEAVPAPVNHIRQEIKRELLLNSDSNSSFSENKLEPQLEQPMPKKRGRKKGSKNHKNLLDDAESSFTNKLAVSASRGNSKVKTTQELLASIQNKNTVLNALKCKEDLNEKAAKLTERVQVIDQKLNTNAGRNKNFQKGKFALSNRNERIIESGSVINDKSLLLLGSQSGTEEEIVVVDDIEPELKDEQLGSDSEQQRSGIVKKEGDQWPDDNVPRSLTVEEVLSLLPPIDKSVLYEQDPEDIPTCSCYLKENKSDFHLVDDDIDSETPESNECQQQPRYEFIEDESCAAKIYIRHKYHADNITDEMVQRLHTTFITNVNGIYSLGSEKPDPPLVPNSDGLYVNVVPNFYEKLDKDVQYFESDDYKKYRVSEGVDESRISDCDDQSQSSVDNRTERVVNSGGESIDNNCDDLTNVKTEDKESSKSRYVFREWYECAEEPTYNGDVLKILPYVVID